MNALSGMDLLIAKTAALFALAFFVPALLAFALTPARRKRRRAIAAPMLLDDEPQNETPQTPPAPAPAPESRPVPVSYLDAAAEAFTAGVVARPQAGPYTPLPAGIVHGASTAAEPANIVIRPQGDNLQRRVSSLAAMTPDSILAAVEHLMRERLIALQSVTEPPPGEDRLAWAVRTIWSTFDGPLFSASLELWLASRNDAELRAALLPQERVFGAASNEWAASLFGPAAAHPQFPVFLEILLDAMRGAAARRVLRSPSSDERLLTEWTLLAEKLLRTTS